MHCKTIVNPVKKVTTTIQGLIFSFYFQLIRFETESNKNMS